MEAGDDPARFVGLRVPGATPQLATMLSHPAIKIRRASRVQGSILTEEHVDNPTCLVGHAALMMAI